MVFGFVGVHESFSIFGDRVVFEGVTSLCLFSCLLDCIGVDFGIFIDLTTCIEVMFSK